MPRRPRFGGKAVTVSTDDALRDAFLGASFADDGWEGALRMLAASTGAARAHLIGVGGSGVLPLNYILDPPPGFTEEFLALNGGSPAVNWRVAVSGAPLQVHSERHYARARALLRSEAYDDFAERHDMVHGCQTVLQRGDGEFVGLATLRTRRDGKTGEADRAIFAQALPFALAAARMQQALEHQAALLLVGALEAMRAAAFVLDSRGRMIACTGAGEAELGDARYLSARGTTLRAADSDSNTQLQAAMAALLDGSRDSSALWLVAEGIPRAPRRCELFALPRRDWSFGHEPRLVAVLRPAADLDVQHRQLLTGLFRLTSAEADVAMRAANGAGREEIAAARDTSQGTVAMQIKSIFQKLDVRREAELVALINRLLR